METETPETKGEAVREFQNAARERSGNLFGEIWGFLHANRKWWLLPLIAVLVVLGGLIVLTSSPLAPFIYTLF